MEYTVRHNGAESLFEVEMERLTACLSYVMDGGKMNITHVRVPGPLEGRGIGAALVKAALDHAREAGLGVIPTCPFARAYILRHPEYQPLMK